MPILEKPIDQFEGVNEDCCDFQTKPDALDRELIRSMNRYEPNVVMDCQLNQ